MKWLRSISIKLRFYLLVLFSLITLLVASTLTIMLLQGALYDFKKHGISQVVVSSLGVAEYFHALEEKGEISKEKAQMFTKEAIKHMRFDSGNYINIITDKGFGVMHPSIENFEGRDMNNLKDRNGKLIAVSHLRSVDNPLGQGFSYYMWPKPGEDDISEKYAFNKIYKPWGWVFSAGDFSDSIKMVVEESVKSSLVVLMVAGLFLGVVSIAVLRSIIGPLQATVDGMNRITGEKLDLTERIRDGGRDELAEVATKFNRMQEEVQTVVCELDGVTCTLSTSSSELVDVAERTRKGSDLQSAEMEQVVTAVNQMADTVNEIARSTAMAADIANISNQKMEIGKENIAGTVASMDLLVSKIGYSSDKIAQLLETAKKVSKVIDVINVVAEQTNLLALNAAIEAARAGGQGRGFAVVADEVRTLAKRVQESTHEIDEIINQVQIGANDASQSMQAVVTEAQTTSLQTRETEDTLEKIIEYALEIYNLNMQIATASEEQAAATEEINQNIMRINNITHEAVGDVRKVKLATDELDVIAKKMVVALDRFVR